MYDPQTAFWMKQGDPIAMGGSWPFWRDAVGVPRWALACVLAALLPPWLAGCDAHKATVPAIAAADVRVPYQYEDTRQLVKLVNDAATLVASKGEKAFVEFARPDSRWFKNGMYLFVFDSDGVCLVHPVAPSLVGQNMLGIRDFDGKPVIANMVRLTRAPAPDASGWFFYLWEDGTQFFPVWKSGYVRKVVAPSGRTMVIGSGLYNLRVEREFVRERVDQAADLLQREGRIAAFKRFQDPSSPFVFLNTYIFVLDMQGKTLVDPAFPTHAGRDLLGFRDAVGKPVVQEMLTKLQHRDAAWVQYKWPESGSHTLARKVAYIRKVQTPEGPVLIGADSVEASPIWMKQ
jgi:hypothetical protein